MPAFQIRRNEFQIRRNEIQAGRNKIQIQRNEIQGKRNKIQIAFLVANRDFSRRCARIPAEVSWRVVGPGRRPPTSGCG
jgi:hypothetical protein